MNIDIDKNLVVIPRVMWKAKDPKPEKEIEETPVPYLLIYHDHKTKCYNKQQCTETVRGMQKKHMDKGESDILYHYVVTSDGTVYEGRNTRSVGRRFPESIQELKETNNQSIVITCLDNGGSELPVSALRALLGLTETLRKKGVVDHDVKLKIYFRDGHPQKEQNVGLRL